MCPQGRVTDRNTMPAVSTSSSSSRTFDRLLFDCEEKLGSVEGTPKLDIEVVGGRSER